VEGLELVTPGFAPYVLPLTVAILVLLFAVQRRGTARVGVVFGPIVCVWFLVLGALGLRGIAGAPEVLLALDPRHAARFFLAHGWTRSSSSARVFLVVTGGEALYADMGHFGRGRSGWRGSAWRCPCLLLNYFGQGALLLREGQAALKNPFFLLAPGWALVPLVLLSTAAVVIASQAIISGAFSLTRQAVHLGFLPRTSIDHTSADEIGQIYVPAVNWLLLRRDRGARARLPAARARSPRPTAWP
jgi:KUP system potassium uptake protein